jgi:hypothetical protein
LEKVRAALSTDGCQVARILVENTLPAFPLATIARAPAEALTAEEEMMTQRFGCACIRFNGHIITPGVVVLRILSVDDLKDLILGSLRPSS